MNTRVLMLWSSLTPPNDVASWQRQCDGFYGRSYGRVRFQKGAKAGTWSIKEASKPMKGPAEELVTIGGRERRIKLAMHLRAAGLPVEV